MRRRARFIPVLLVPALLAAAPCLSQVDLSLPLEGYYRAGRYMPVRVSITVPLTGRLTITADGAVPVIVELAGRPVSAVVPLLVVRGPLGPIHWSLADGRGGRAAGNLVPLGDDEFLIGYAGADPAAASQLRGSRSPVAPSPVAPSPVAVQLDLSDPLPGTPLAWEALDAVLLDRPPDPYRVAMLTAGGTAVAVRSAGAPNDAWVPWRRLGDMWVIDQAPAGPSGAVLPEAYEPVYGWRPGRSAAMRRRVVSWAVVFAILAAALTLWRSRRAVFAIAALSAIATAALMLWAARVSPVVGAGGTVLVRRGERFQADEWVYFKSIAPAEAEFPFFAPRPVFASTRHFEASAMRLECGPDGVPVRFTFRLGPDAAMAFMMRFPMVRGDPSPPDPAALDSPLWPLVRRLYLGPRTRTIGQTGAGPALVDPPLQLTEEWPDIVIESVP